MAAHWKQLKVEDEDGNVNLKKKSIDFEALGLELVGTAENGKKGLELIHIHKPDIVITDIYMPVMNGIDMITRANEDGVQSQFIIISGLTQFKYAMSALNSGVCGYLLKPLNKEELNILLEKTIHKIAKSQQVEYQLNIMESMMGEKRKELRNSYLFDMLYFRERVEGKPSEYINDKYGFSFADEASVYTIGVLLIDGLKSLNYSASKTIIEQLAMEAGVHINPMCREMEIYQRGNGFVFLCNYAKADMLRFKGLLSNEYAVIRQKFESNADIRISMSISKPVYSLSDSLGALDSALTTLQARIILGSENVLYAEKLADLKPKRVYRLTEKEAISLFSAIDLKQNNKVRLSLENIYKTALASAKEAPCYLYDILSDLTFDISILLYRKNITGRLTNKASNIYRNAVSQRSSEKSITEFSVKHIMDMLPDFDSQSKAESDIASNIRKYIEEHLSEPLRLETVAAEFFLSTSYFGTVFKNEIGESFSSYLLSVRINRAKELLANSNDTVDMIAGKCGYQDRKHFSKLFASMVGVKPNEYRKLNR